MKEIKCKLTTPELQKRKATVIADLKSQVLGKRELPNGYSYQFDGSDVNLDKLNEFIKTERLCCDFFTFQLNIEEESAILSITGPDGVKQFLQEEINF